MILLNDARFCKSHIEEGMFLATVQVRFQMFEYLGTYYVNSFLSPATEGQDGREILGLGQRLRSNDFQNSYMFKHQKSFSLI